MANRLAIALGLSAALACAVAPAQDARRRPGEGADRQSDVPVPARPKPPSEQTAPAAKPGAQPAPEAAPGGLRPADKRRRPGEGAPLAQPLPPPVEPALPAEGRRRPGQPDYTRPDASGDRPEPGAPRELRVQAQPNRASGLAAVPKPGADAEFKKVAVDDRWQIARSTPLSSGVLDAKFPIFTWSSLTPGQGMTNFPLLDPYNQNTLKSDRPLWSDWFFNLGLISDTVYEPRRIPTPTSPSGDRKPGQLEVIGSGEQSIFNQALTVSLIYFKGNTTFKPPDWEFRLVPVINYNRVEVDQARVLNIDPRKDTRRREDFHVGIQELFVDKHLRNVSDRYDFDSLRIGIQPFTADFRGFLFQEQQLGARLFGIRDNNRWQYNLAYFRRLEKDTNSLLNDLDQDLRKDDIYVANLYRQDFPVLGFTSQAVVLHNRNREGDEGLHFNQNGQIERPASLGLEQPRNYDATYLGYNGDGHFGRLNLTASFTYVFGDTSGGVFVEEETDISAAFAAAEASVDFDWTRVRLSALYASGDKDPFDDEENGFDAVAELPIFAGADTSFYIRQNVPLIGGGGVALAGRNGVLNSLRSSLAEGQSNFTNPGTVLLGIGTDHDLSGQFRVSTNFNYLWFDRMAVIETARNQGDIGREIGLDASVATIWRPFFTQNLILRTSAAALIPGDGYKALYGDEVGYSVLVNLILTY